MYAFQRFSDETVLKGKSKYFSIRGCILYTRGLL